MFRSFTVLQCSHQHCVHSIKVDLNCLDPGNVHLNDLNAPVLNVLITVSQFSAK